jgi:hypothetical protein
MRRRGLLAIGLIVTMYAGLTAQANGQVKPGGEPYAKCAKACADCKALCDACVKHCQSMVSAGMKEHAKSLALSRDAADVCNAAARIVSRKGPLSKPICEACLKACEACGSECRKYPTMKPMKDCADSCARCTAACRDMLSHVKG